MKVLAACLLSSAGAAHAVPITYEFTTSVPRAFGYATPGAGEFAIPAAFTDPAAVAAATLSGTFTIESDVAPRTSNVTLDGVPTPAVSVYWNSVTQMTLDVLGQRLEYVSSIAPGTLPPPVETRISVTDIPGPTVDPNTSFDAVGLNVQFGADALGSEFTGLRTTLQLTRIERDLGLITNRDMVENLVFTPNWLVNLAFIEASTNRVYAIYTYGASLERVDEDPVGVPEPGTLGLMAFALGAAALASRRRRQTTA